MSHASLAALTPREEQVAKLKRRHEDAELKAVVGGLAREGDWRSGPGHLDGSFGRGNPKMGSLAKWKPGLYFYLCLSGGFSFERAPFCYLDLCHPDHKYGLVRKT